MRSVTPKKVRHEVAIQRFASPQRDAAPRDLEGFWDNPYAFAEAWNAQWQDAGPCNFTGRTTCLVADPSNPKRLYAGSAAGGLWRSEDGAKHWTSCWPPSLSQCIGAVAVNPDHPTFIVCATGEGNLDSASYPGSGIYVSEDGAFTWRPAIWNSSQPGRMSSQERDQMPRRVASISVSAKDSKGLRKFAVGSVSNDEGLVGGLFWITMDKGMFFDKRWSTRPYNCYSAVFHPTQPDTLYASIEAGGAINGIWRTTDSGKSWERLSDGLPRGELCGRISLAISPSHPDHLFALISSRPIASLRSGRAKGQHVLGVFRSTNGGLKWEKYPGKDFAKEGHLQFNNTIAIHPTNPQIAVCGAQNLFLTEDGGDTWSQISGGLGEAIFPDVHRDQHAIVMPGGDDIFVANDGGVYRSKDLGLSWQPSSHGMSTIMFYALDVSPVNAHIYGGGSQDNGTLMAGVNEGAGLRRPGDIRFTQVLSGDGGYLVCDPHQEEMAFGSLFSTETHYHHPGKPWKSSGWQKASPPVPLEEAQLLGLTVMAIRSAGPAAGEPRQLFLGTNRIWRSTYRKPHKLSRQKRWVWRTSSARYFDGSAICAIEIAAANPKVMFVGTARGGIYRSADGGRRWSEDLAGPEIPNHVITQIETHPENADEVVVTVASSTREALTLTGEKRQFSHVFRSRNAGQLWEDIDQGQLPNVVLNGLAYETQEPFRIFVAGDAGPWVLQDGRWASISGNMPSAVISDIIYHRKTKTLFAGTYGRGIWRMSIPAKFKIAEGRQEHNLLLPPREGYRLSRRVRPPKPLVPAQGAILKFEPGNITKLSCTRVPKAVGYAFEIRKAGLLFNVVTSRTPEAPVGSPHVKDPFTWRCWALMADSRCSLPSTESKFSYLE